MSFRNDSPSKFMHFCPRQVTPNQFKLIQGGDPEHLKSSQGLASLPPITHVHSHHHHWKSWFLEKLFSDCRTPVAFVSRYLVIERLTLFLSKYKKTRGSLQLWMFHSLLNLEQALKYHVINSISQSPTPNHLCSLPPPPPLEKLVPEETIYWLQNFGSICVQIFSHWKTYFIFVKIQEN